MVGFDCVDDESKPERRPTKHMPKPADWNNKYNAAYSYYIYYLFANLFVLNSFRQSRGLNTFTFRCAPPPSPPDTLRRGRGVALPLQSDHT